ncbi:hypothetical protein ACS15_0541 [Ralstonia insidiosa]|uniref:Uncharacterized protein n=1 Tax=Ralstonia insidiosa TaxID=190721 RepID=A0AAC9FQ34_9RALS|nr:hypothetical protein ACS15_0541 [Ralstonia insidiosa]
MRGLAHDALRGDVYRARLGGGLCVEDRDCHGKAHAPYGEQCLYQMADG